MFVSGTRADFGKLKPLIKASIEQPGVECLTFVTGMHTLPQFGDTWQEFEKESIPFTIFKNHPGNEKMDVALSNTLIGLSQTINEWGPSHVVVHGDRVEALAGAIAAVLNNVLCMHIEGGEISGTVDESLRHSVSKLAHIHLVSNASAKDRLEKMGEDPSKIFILGSPELDVIDSGELPKIEEVKDRYQIDFDSYGICIFHPVTTELDSIHSEVDNLIEAMDQSGRNFVVIESNNDLGSSVIRSKLKAREEKDSLRIIPSMRFEFFITLMRNSDFILGNSSVGVREAPFLGVPSINIGSRQAGRNLSSDSIVNCSAESAEILEAINLSSGKRFPRDSLFGDGNSVSRFKQLLDGEAFHRMGLQKMFYESRVADE